MGTYILLKKEKNITKKLYDKDVQNLILLHLKNTDHSKLWFICNFVYFMFENL